LAIGTIQKSILSGSIGAGAGLLNLLDIANTKNYTEAFSLSKSVLLDYNFYSYQYKPLYYIGIYIITVVSVIGAILNITKKNKLITISSLFFLVLFSILSMGGGSFIGELVNTALMESPIGWVFRSPLKWQLYIPFFLIILFSLSLSFIYKTITKKDKIVFTGFISIFFLLINSYILIDIFNKLLTPKKLIYTENLENNILNGKNILFINDKSCSLLSKKYPAILEEIHFFLKNQHAKTIKLNSPGYLSP
jgi:hypothetical protein